MVSDAYRLRHAARKLDKGTGCESRTVTAAVSAETISVGESQSLGQPEKAGQILLEARVGRPTVSSECCFGMVMAMFCPLVKHAMTIFCVVSRYNFIYVSVAGRGVQTVRLNKRTGCKSPRCRHCKCRDGLPLVKASHWSISRRQTGQSLETQVRRPTETFGISE